MSNRATFLSALALIAPVLAVLLAVLVLAPPAAPTPTSATGAGVPGGASGSRDSANAVSLPNAAPAPTPRPSGPPAPELLDGGAWINAEPLTLAGLNKQRKVVLIDFWTYSCYNCQNTLPYVKQWWEKYKDQGLVIVGVHTPEFAYEKELANVRQAVEDQGIGWPVVQDNDMRIWRAYGNHYWPRFYLVDERGQIIYDHIGEGAYDETEHQIQAALAAAKSDQ
ncbi:MAG: redoxin domain-containing protein [Roseiflexaceae bacterium]